MDDDDSWLGADGIHYGNAGLARLSIQKAREADELARRLRELDAFAMQHGYDPKTRAQPRATFRQLTEGRGRATMTEYFDVALSFAGENRPYVSAVAEVLRSRGISVFYDDFYKADLWGKNLYTYLSDVYQNRSTYTVIFASQFYAKKVWTNLEREAAQSRAIRENREYILPARFDETAIPGLLSTVGYIDLQQISAEVCADLIVQKLECTRQVN